MRDAETEPARRVEARNIRSFAKKYALNEGARNERAIRASGTASARALNNNSKIQNTVTWLTFFPLFCELHSPWLSGVGRARARPVPPEATTFLRAGWFALAIIAIASLHRRITYAGIYDTW